MMRLYNILAWMWCFLCIFVPVFGVIYGVYAANSFVRTCDDVNQCAREVYPAWGACVVLLIVCVLACSFPHDYFTRVLCNESNHRDISIDVTLVNGDEYRFPMPGATPAYDFYNFVDLPEGVVLYHRGTPLIRDRFFPTYKGAFYIYPWADCGHVELDGIYEECQA